VRRSRQVDQLRGATGPLLVLTAPPGYGKTTVLGQWAQEDDRPFLWVSLDAGDNDPAVLLMYLTQAFSGSVRFGANLFAGPLDDQEFFRTVTLPRLGLALAHRARPFVLVLDDTHVLKGPVWDLVSFLVEHVATGSQLVLSGRTEPDLTLQCLRTHPKALQLRASDLVMTVDEAQMLARSAGTALDVTSAAALVRRTEGWPASLYLAVLSLRGRIDPRSAVTGFTGNDRLVSEYIQEEVLAPADDEVRRFLLRTSVLRTLSGPLCDAVLRSTGSARMLERINRANVLLTSLGHGQEWYRYHQLFADVLRSELHRTEPEIEVVLHRRASDWYHEQGDTEEAVSHAHAAGDRGRAAELIWMQVVPQLAAGRVATLERWLAAFEPKRLLEDPFLALTAAACALVAGRNVASWMTIARHAAEQRWAPERRDPGEVELVIHVFRAVMARHGASQMAIDAETLSRIARPDSPAQALARYLQGVASDQLGDAAQAQLRLQEGVELSVRLGMPDTEALCLAYLTYLDCLAAKWLRMGELAARTRKVVESSGIQDFISMASVYATLALALAHLHQHEEEAAEAARHASWLLSGMAPIAPWLNLHTTTVLARTHVLLGDAAAARMLLAEAQQVAALVPDAPELLRRLDDVWRLAQAAPLTTRLGPSTISPAELRVLRLLPTNLSFAEIGELLFLTRNTVKTQALAAYRKLGVSSRSEAVEQAKVQGLIHDRPAAFGAPLP
jgi:LuxR family maltose regulon positive regulatory protein